MADKKVSNAEAVKAYHSKLVNLATIRVPSEEISGIDYKEKVYQYLCDRYGEKKEGVPNKSMNEFVLDLIEADMNKWYKKQNQCEYVKEVIKDKIVLAKGVKDLK